MNNVQGTRTQIIEILQEILGNNIDAEEIDSSKSLLEEGILDSMSVIDVVLKIEEKFGFEFKNEEMLLENFNSIDMILKCVEGYLDA